MHDQVVAIGFGPHAERGQLADGRGQAVGLLDPQLGPRRGTGCRPRPRRPPRPAPGSRRAGRGSRRRRRRCRAARCSGRRCRCPRFSTSAPMRRSTSRNPVRAWPGVDVLDHDVAAGHDACGHHPERGLRRVAGHVELEGRQRRRAQPDHGPPSASMSMSAPHWASISSVWARVGTCSRTTVSPSAPRPASSTALHLGAGHRERVVDAVQAAAVDPQRRVTGRRPSTVAPMSRSGSATRSIGLRDSDSSPVSSVTQGKAAQNPASRRMPVPELPTSTTPVRLVQAAQPAGDDGRRRSRRPSARRRQPCAARRRRRTGRARSTCPRPGPPAAGPGARSTCRPAPARCALAAGPASVDPRTCRVEPLTERLHRRAGSRGPAGRRAPGRRAGRRPRAAARRGRPRPSGRSRGRRC